jgi:hypothetical protein
VSDTEYGKQVKGRLNIALRIQHLTGKYDYLISISRHQYQSSEAWGGREGRERKRIVWTDQADRLNGSYSGPVHCSLAWC